MRKLTVEYPPGSGKSREGITVDVVSSKEPWAEYELQDGSRIKAKAVLVDVIKIEGEFDQDGNPAYVLKANGMMSVDAPAALRRK